MAVNGKQKGNQFERDMANYLSSKFSSYLGIQNGFRRSIDSGSFFGKSNQKRIDTHDTDTATFGDIMCPKSFKYSVECKNYKTAPKLDSIFKQNLKQWDDWLIQAEQDAKNSNKRVCLIVKYNNTTPFVFCEYDNIGETYLFKYKKYFCYTLDVFFANQDVNLYFEQC